MFSPRAHDDDDDDDTIEGINAETSSERTYNVER
jgi:hypothetical protein